MKKPCEDCGYSRYEKKQQSKIFTHSVYIMDYKYFSIWLIPTKTTIWSIHNQVLF